MKLFLSILYASGALFVEMAPYLLLGFLVAGILSIFISPDWVEKHLGKKGWWQVIKASLFGVPLPLCSCGVLPVAASLRRHGASRGATTSFLLSTPQTGVDSIAVTWVLLGPVVAIIRPVAAFLTGMIGGMWVQTATEEIDTEQTATLADLKGGCDEDECCDNEPADSDSRWIILRRVLSYGFITLPRDIGKALLLGLLISGVIATFIAPNSLQHFLGQGILPYLAAMTIGIPLYVCATASTPIAASLVAAGLSPGAALVFLISGPATNSASITTLVRILGKKTVMIYLLTVALGSLITGWLTDIIMNMFGYKIPLAEAIEAHQHHSDWQYWLNLGSAFLLAAVLVYSLWPRRSTLTDASEETEERRLDLDIQGMRCQGCVDSITRALSEIGGVTTVEVDLGEGRAVVRGVSDSAPLLRAVESLGFECKPG